MATGRDGGDSALYRGIRGVETSHQWFGKNSGLVVFKWNVWEEFVEQTEEIMA